MTTVEELEDQDDLPHVGWVPRVITGGKGPSEPSGHNWLAEFIPGTTFVARHNNSKEVDYNLYHVSFMRLPEVVLLQWQLPDGKVLDYYVDPERFSKQFKLGAILAVIKPEAPEGDENDQCDRADKQTDLVLPPAMPGEHQVVPEAE